ncbi:MAG: CHASE2 domain-containing protein [Pseudomonadota bacterium]
MSLIERLQDRNLHLSLGLLICLLVALLLSVAQGSDGLSRRILDRQFNLLHEHAARPLVQDVVVVGIDEASLRKFQEPLALWHPHLERFLRAMQVAEPAVVGVDVELPQHSYEALLPGYEDGLIQALRQLREHSPVVLARKPNPDGSLRTLLASLVEDDATAASVALCVDPDGVVRRFDPNRCTVNAQGSTFTERVVAQLGVIHPGTGLIDFSAGGKLDFIPFDSVLEWQARDDKARLRAAFSGKLVLLGLLSAREGLVNVPVPLAVHTPILKQVPEVLVQAQILRSMMGGGLVQETSAWLGLCLAFAAALFWLGRTSWGKLLTLGVLPVLLGLLATWLLARGIYLPSGGILLSALFAFSARFIYDAVQQMRARSNLRALFDSYVSHKVLQKIVRGRIETPDTVTRIRVCLLYARIRGFNDRMQGEQAQAAVALLNEYLEEMTLAIHQCSGTLDRLVGSDLLAFFGAPLAVDSPERSALEAAQAMLLRLREMNRRLQERGWESIAMVIALHVGEVVVGHVGPPSRRGYTALGDEVGVVMALAASMESAEHAVICSAGVAEAVGAKTGFGDCGERDVLGRRLHVYSWQPPLLERR